MIMPGKMEICVSQLRSMVKLNDDMKGVMSKVRIFPFATASKKGEPNVVPIGMLMLRDDETVWIIDNYMKKTLANVKENPRASFYVWDPEQKNSYQIKGDITVENAGKDYEEAKRFANDKGYPGKDLLLMRITDVYCTRSGKCAGKKLL